MVDQAAVRGAASRPGPTATDPSNGKTNGQGNGVIGSIADLGNDITTLAELQAKLAALDLKDCADRAIMPLGFLVAAAVVVAGCIPVVLLGIADVVARAFGIVPGWAMLLTAGIALAFGGIVLFVAARTLGRSFTSLRRSREELERNLAWVRTVLVYSGRSFPRRGL